MANLDKKQKEKLKDDFLFYISIEYGDLSERDKLAVKEIVTSSDFPEHSGAVECSYVGEDIVFKYSESGKLVYKRGAICGILDKIDYLSSNSMIKKAEQ